MRAPLARYPPSVYQVSILAEMGCAVTVVNTRDGGHSAVSLPGSVTERVVVEESNPWLRKSRWRRLFTPVRRILFQSRMLRILAEAQPRVVVVCEPPAIAALLRSGWRRLAPRCRTIWHLHEHPELNPCFGIGTRRDIALVRTRLAEPDLLVVPDQGRLNLLAREWAGPLRSQVVMNCPRRLERLPAAMSRNRLTGFHPVESGLVLYCGSVGPGRGVLAGLESMARWPKDSVFAILGPCSGAFAQRIRERAAALGMADRVNLAGPLPPEQLWAARRAADVALTIFEDYDLNSRFSAGASNKRFEAMAAGIPQVTDNNPGVPEMIAANGCGLCVPPDKPQEIGKSVANLLENPALRRTMGQRARDLHLRRFNYEAEFEPVANAISNWLKE